MQRGRKAKASQQCKLSSKRILSPPLLSLAFYKAKALQKQAAKGDRAKLGGANVADP